MASIALTMATVFLAFLSLLASVPPSLGIVRVPMQKVSVPAGKETLKKTDQSLEYYGSVSIGTPPQDMLMLFDTGSSIFSVLNASCSIPECQQHHLYDHSKSSTYRKLYGGRSSDIIQVAGLTVKGQMFVEENNIDIVVDSHYDGMIGLGFPMPGQGLILANMLEQKLIDKPVFSFFLTRDKGDYGGELLFGGTDPTHYTGSITYLPVTSDMHWQVHMNGIRSTELLCDNVCQAGCEAIVDTGTSVITGPLPMADLLNRQLKATKEANGMYSLDCNQVPSLPTVMVTLNGQHFPLTHEDYVIEVERDGKECLSGFVGVDLPLSNTTWILGNIFLAKYYSVFNLEAKSVGLAPAAKKL